MNKLHALALALSLSLTAPGLPAWAADPGIPTDEADAPEEPTQTAGFYSGFDPRTRQITTHIATADGKSLTLVVDQATNTVYLSNATGATAEIPIPALAQAYSQGDPAKYATFMDTMQRALNTNMAMETVAKGMGTSWELPNGLAHPCDMQPCGVLQRQFVDYNLDSIFRWSPDNVDYSYENWYTRDEIDEDQDDFEIWRNQQCSAADDEQSDAVWGFALGVLACSNPEGIITIAICAASTGSALNDDNQSRNAQRNCRMQYPGPGRWGR